MIPDLARTCNLYMRPGWGDEEIYYAITVCALFDFYNRWIDTSGVHAMSDEAHQQNAKPSAWARVCPQIARPEN